jgi:glucokinase
MTGTGSIALAVDIGGSKFITALVREDGKILASAKQSWTVNQTDTIPATESLVSDLKHAIHAIIKANPQYKPRIMGATIPGLTDPEKGLWVEASFSGIKNLPFAAIMETEFHLPVKIENDVRACALAERVWGCCASPAVDDFIWITVSNGIGGCVFADGKPYRGASGNAGEIGHIIVEEGLAARPCKAGHSGCAEMHASGQALVLNYLGLGGKRIIDGEEATAKNIATLALAGDKTAIATYEMEGLYLGRAIGAAVNLLSPAKIIMGGGVSMDFSLFKQSLEKSLMAHIYKNATPSLTLEVSPLGYHAALLGAAALAFK